MVLNVRTEYCFALAGCETIMLLVLVKCCLEWHAPFVRRDRRVLRSRCSHHDVAPSTREGQSMCGTPEIKTNRLIHTCGAITQ